MDPILLNLLKNTNLGEKESMIYLAVLNLGSASASDIAKLTDIKRPTVYNLLDDLISKRYITEDSNSKINRYIATDPVSLANELDVAARDFREMLPYLQSIHKKSGKPIVSYYTGVRGAKIIFEQIRRPREVYYATSIDKINEFLPDEVTRWKKAYQTGKARPNGFHLLSDTQANQEYAKTLLRAKQRVRFLNKNSDLKIDFVLYDGKVVLTTFDENIAVTLIESKALFESLKTIFLLAWQSASEK